MTPSEEAAFWKLKFQSTEQELHIYKDFYQEMRIENMRLQALVEQYKNMAEAEKKRKDNNESN
jgi:hypothetical protein